MGRPRCRALSRLLYPTLLTYRKVGDRRVQVNLRDGETFESLLRRFKAGVARDGILSDFRRAQAFISKGERIRMKIRKAERRRLRKSARRSS